MKKLEKWLEKHPKLKEYVRKLIDEYQEKEYAHVATAEELAGTSSNKTHEKRLREKKREGNIFLLFFHAHSNSSLRGFSL